MIVAREGDELADPTVDSKILALKSGGADMLLMGGYSRQVSQALQKMAAMGWKPKIYMGYIGASVSPTFMNVGLENAKGKITATPDRSALEERQ